MEFKTEAVWNIVQVCQLFYIDVAMFQMSSSHKGNFFKNDLGMVYDSITFISC